MSEYERYEHAGAVITLHWDEDPQDPRKWNDCYLGRMLCWHDRYMLGDDQVAQDSDAIHDVLDAAGADVVMPLYLYDHSGITMSTSTAGFSAADRDAWDWGMVGVIYSTPATRAALGLGPNTDLDLVRTYLAGEVEEYDHYLTGQVYGYTVEKEGELLDSCWGFFGDDGLTGARQEAEYAADNEAANAEAIGFYEAAH